jgi:hypothetical protein
VAASDYPNAGFANPEARAISLSKFQTTIAELKDLVIDAQVEVSVDKRREAIVKAAKIACRMMTDLWDGLDRLISSTLENLGVDDNVEAPITFGILIARDTDLTYLTGRDNFRVLLRSIVDVVALRGRVPAKAVTSLVENTLDQFEELKGQRLSTKDILTQVGRVRRAVCRPPFNEGGAIARDQPKGPNGGGGRGFLKSLRDLADDIGRIITVVTVLGWIQSTPFEKLRVGEPPTLPPTELPAFRTLALLLMFCAIAECMLDNGLISISTEVLDPDLTYHVDPVPEPAFAGVGEGLFAESANFLSAD